MYFTLIAAKDWQIAGTWAAGGVHASFWRRANENVHVGVELEASLRTLESVTTLAYQFDLPKMNLLFKGELKFTYVCCFNRGVRT